MMVDEYNDDQYNDGWLMVDDVDGLFDALIDA